MRCPRCNQEGLSPFSPCSQCGFSGPPAQIEELSHIGYLLGEMETWPKIPPSILHLIRERYVNRRTELEQALGLRPVPLTAEEARYLKWQVVCFQKLRDKIVYWLGRGWIGPEAAERMGQEAGRQVEALEKRLAGAPAGFAPSYDRVMDHLAVVDYVMKALVQAKRHGDLLSDEAYEAAIVDLKADRDEIEIGAGLKPRPAKPEPAPEAEAAVAAQPKAEEAGARAVRAAPARPSRPPRQPLTRERLWQTLLSERTLNVILFLGAFLLIASATTYVVANWETLPPWAQLAAIVLFTLSFYGSGWFLRIRMGLRASGMAITAVGSLLVPLDFYAVFVAGGLWPADRWPWVWLIAAVVCLPIYTFTAFRLRAPFFGYLVAVAAGNIVCAAVQVVGLPPEWWLVALAALALTLAVMAYRFRSNLLSDPLRFSSLVAAAAILPLGLGWWLALGVKSLDFDVSLAGSWLLGAALFAYAAVRERSPLLGRAAATALAGAVPMLLRLPFEPWQVEAPWYALGWAVLGPAYVIVGRRWLSAGRTGRPEGWNAGRLEDGRAESIGEAKGAEGESTLQGDAASERREHGDAVLSANGGTAVGWGLFMMAAAALFAVLDLWAAAATHAVLTVGLALVVRVWDRPRSLPVVSLLALSAATFAMAASHLQLSELALGWALLAVLHVVAGIRLRAAPGYAAPLFAAVFPLAGLAVLAPLVLADEPLLTYTVGHWIVLAAWWLWLDQSGEHPGLETVLSRFRGLRPSLVHWAIAAPLPFFASLLYTRLRPPDAWLGLLLSGVAWASFAIGQLPRLLKRGPSPAALPWHLVAYGCSLAGPVAAFYYYDQPVLAVTVLLAAGLYFTSAWSFRRGEWLVPGGLALPAGLVLLLEHWQVGWAEQSVVLAAIAGGYLLGALWLERRRGVPRTLTRYLAGTGHAVAFGALICGLAPAFGPQWPDSAKVWAAGGALILSAAYALYAWFEVKESWAHIAIWLSVLAGALVALAYGQGRGSSALKVALLAVVYVLLERGLAWRAARGRPWAAHAWPLYRRALLIAGWIVSGAAIALALGRNLVLLGGGRTREIWAIAGLLTIAGLYAASAWMFRRRLFLWLAGGLVFLPWTLLTAWGWFVWAPPSGLRQYAVSWAVLSCVELLVGIALTPSLWTRRLGKGEFGFPLRVWANLFLPFALVWGIADSGVSCLTWEIGIVFYILSALVDHWRGLAGWRAARFLYLAVALVPVWAVYLLNHTLPYAPYELYGILLLALALPLLAVGRGLRRVRTDDALPLYLGAYAVAAVGTLLVASQRPLAALALTFDLLLCVLSARLFREPAWGYPAAALAPAALLLALAGSAVPPERRGWPLIALGAVCLAIAWLFRRAGRRDFALPPLAAAFAVIGLGLPPSSLDDVGAFWGYLAAALLYAVGAAWLRQPLLLTPALALLAVPYGVAVANLPLARADYGLAVFPGVAAALALAHLLDARLGQRLPALPSWDPRAWRLAPLLDWWAAPAYGAAYLGTLAGASLSWNDSGRLAIALLLAAATFLHATWRFRRREALLIALGLAQGAALAALEYAGWGRYPGWAALGFLPVTVGTAVLGLAIEWRRREGSPIGRAWWAGWSRPFYLLLAVDVLAGQAAALAYGEPGAAVTLAHAALLAVLATAWADGILPFAAALLGALGLLQALSWADVPWTSYPVAMALLALGYGLIGYGLQALRSYLGWPPMSPGARRVAVWRRPLEWIGLGLSGFALLAGLVLGLSVVRLVVRAVLGQALTVSSYAPELRMATWLLAITGLLYLAAAVVHRWRALGYGAVALLLGSWALWWRFLIAMPQFQWYAVPAGLYLFGIGWLEWRSGNRALARWVDRAGVLVWLGSSWWQSLSGLDDSWPYALIMGVEALLLLWWGSARRQKQFLYVGMMGIILDALTQSVEPLLTVNRWIVFGLAGLLLVGVAVLVERRLDRIRTLSAELRGRLEAWE